MGRGVNYFLVAIAVLLLQTVNTTQEHDSRSSINQEHYPEGKHDESFDHDAILGSKQSEEEFSHLTPEEAKKRLATLVDKMDKNKDGNVDKDELKEWVKNSFMKLDSEEADKRHNEQDTDRDGKVTWDDYLNHVYNYKPEDLEEFAKDQSEDMKEFIKGVLFEKKKFLAADKDMDGALNQHEYGIFYHPQDSPDMTALEVERTMEDYDKNKDGKVNQDEYVSKTADREQREVEREQFNEYDKDKNAFLDVEEVRSWVMPDTDEIAMEEVTHLFGESDSDQDGVLTKDEIVAQHELWVGSSATGYGDDLAKKREEL